MSSFAGLLHVGSVKATKSALSVGEPLLRGSHTGGETSSLGLLMGTSGSSLLGIDLNIVLGLSKTSSRGLLLHVPLLEGRSSRGLLILRLTIFLHLTGHDLSLSLSVLGLAVLLVAEGLGKVGDQRLLVLVCLLGDGGVLSLGGGRLGLGSGVGGVLLKLGLGLGKLLQKGLVGNLELGDLGLASSVVHQASITLGAVRVWDLGGSTAAAREDAPFLLDLQKTTSGAVLGLAASAVLHLAADIGLRNVLLEHMVPRLLDDSELLGLLN